MSLEEFFEEIDRHLMEDERPSEYLRQVEIREEALLGLCDRLGRDGVDERKEKESVREFLLACAVGEGELG